MIVYILYHFNFTRNRHEKNFISAAIESIDPETIGQLAVKSGFQKRKPRKITPLDLVNTYCLEAAGKSPSHNDIAGLLGDSPDAAPSRQAVAKRTNERFVDLLQLLLLQILHDKAVGMPPQLSEAEADFSRIVVQDSTVIKLPGRLFDEYSGVTNAHATACNARIQGAYELLSREFLSFSIDKYSKNDLTAAPELEVRPGDLILRDRGYLTRAEIKRIQDTKAYHITRHGTLMSYRDPVTDRGN